MKRKPFRPMDENALNWMRQHSESKSKETVEENHLSKGQFRMLRQWYPDSYPIPKPEPKKKTPKNPVQRVNKSLSSAMSLNVGYPCYEPAKPSPIHSTTQDTMDWMAGMERQIEAVILSERETRKKYEATLRSALTARL